MTFELSKVKNMKRTANARWAGDLQTGHGELTTQSHVLNQTKYSFDTRFADGKGSNPEELLAAAHAGCFTMSVSNAISHLGFTPGELHTTAKVNLDMVTRSISQVELELTCNAIAGLSDEEFLRVATQSKQNCLISKALSAISITLKVVYHETALVS